MLHDVDNRYTHRSFPFSNSSVMTVRMIGMSHCVMYIHVFVVNIVKNNILVGNQLAVPSCGIIQTIEIHSLM